MHQIVWSTIRRIDKNSITTVGKGNAIEHKHPLNKVYAIFERIDNGRRGKLLYLNKQNLEKRGIQINNLYNRYNMHFLFGVSFGLFIVVFVASTFKILQALVSLSPLTTASKLAAIGLMFLLASLLVVFTFFDNLFHMPMNAIWEKWEDQYHEILRDSDNAKT